MAPVPSTLTASRLALRVLFGGTSIVGLLILGILLALIFAGESTAEALEFSFTPETADRVVWSLRAILVLALLAIPAALCALSKALAIVETVRSGDPFVPVNAERLRTVGWAVLALQIVQLGICLIAESIPGPTFDCGGSVAGWLAVLLLFVLARVFAEGARMREELAGTV